MPEKVFIYDITFISENSGELTDRVGRKFGQWSSIAPCSTPARYLELQRMNCERHSRQVYLQQELSRWVAGQPVYSEQFTGIAVIGLKTW